MENTFSTRRGCSGENPLTSALVDGRTDLAQGLFDQVFEEAIELEEISFVMAYTSTGGKFIVCPVCFYKGQILVAKKRDQTFFLNFDSFLRSAIEQPTRNIVRITDLQVEKALSVNDSLSFGLRDANDEAVALIVVGKNLVDNLRIIQ